MFSAVAMIAFVGTSMASVSEVDKAAGESAQAVFSQCTDVYHATYISAKKNGANDTQAGNVAYDAYLACADKAPTKIVEALTEERTTN